MRLFIIISLLIKAITPVTKMVPIIIIVIFQLVIIFALSQ
ncbi:hypothetical protein P20495_3019 [Pseudoalteromonas sp. BSi20495]|nr:hypothetical protein P20495_3019 [Pseudoalteromonas sp. BSi20495]